MAAAAEEKEEEEEEEEEEEKEEEEEEEEKKEAYSTRYRRNGGFPSPAISRGEFVCCQVFFCTCTVDLRC